MGRYIADYYTEEDVDLLFSKIYVYLTGEGYRYVQYNGENVFFRDAGNMIGETYFKFSHSGRVFRMEAWMEAPDTGTDPFRKKGLSNVEVGLSGLEGALVRGPLKERVRRVEEIILLVPSAEGLYSAVTFDEKIEKEKSIAKRYTVIFAVLLFLCVALWVSVILFGVSVLKAGDSSIFFFAMLLLNHMGCLVMTIVYGVKLIRRKLLIRRMLRE